MKFKDFLSEAKEGYFAPWHITDPEKVKQWVETHSIEASKARVNKDGTLTSLQDHTTPNLALALADINGERKHVFMLKYKRAKTFIIISPSLSSLWGMPDVCSGGVSLICSGLKSLEHLTPEISGGPLVISCSKLEELNCGTVHCKWLTLQHIGKLNLAKDWKQFSSFKVDGKITIRTSVANDLLKKPILSLCKLLKATGAVSFVLADTDKPEYPELYKVIQIVNEHYKDIMDCQEALMDAGLEEYAKF